MTSPTARHHASSAQAVFQSSTRPGWIPLIFSRAGPFLARLSPSVERVLGMHTVCTRRPPLSLRPGGRDEIEDPERTLRIDIEDRGVSGAAHEHSEDHGEEREDRAERGERHGEVGKERGAGEVAERCDGDVAGGCVDRADRGETSPATENRSDETAVILSGCIAPNALAGDEPRTSSSCEAWELTAPAPAALPCPAAGPPLPAPWTYRASAAGGKAAGVAAPAGARRGDSMKAFGSASSAAHGIAARSRAARGGP